MSNHIIAENPAADLTKPKGTKRKFRPVTEYEREHIIKVSSQCKTYLNKLIPPFPLSPDLVPYCLRHTYCTDLARMGVDIRMAQKLMGHTDITLTANIYTNFSNEDIVSAAKIIQGCNMGATSNVDK